MYLPSNCDGQGKKSIAELKLSEAYLNSRIHESQSRELPFPNPEFFEPAFKDVVGCNQSLHRLAGAVTVGRHV